MLTLWDLLDPLLNRLQPAKKPAPPKPRPRPPAPPAAHGRVVVQAPAAARPQAIAQPPRSPKPKRAPSQQSDASMQAKYDAVVQLMLKTYGIRVRKWRSSMSGVAWYVTYRDGSVQRLIESPKPKGPMSAAVFLHEIGHHAIGFDVYKPRCLEEYHAWRWSLEQMDAHGLNITDAVRLRMHRSLWYAVEKAKRRGIKAIPSELAPFMERPATSRRRRSTRR